MRRRFFPSIPQSITVFAFWLLLVDVVDMGHVMMALLLAIVLPWVSERLEREFARLG